MQPINALSLAPAVNNWLTNSRHPRILHVFDHACNLINECMEVLSIVTPQIGNGPFNLVMDTDIFFSEHLNLQSPVSITLNHLTLDNLIIHTQPATLWSPRPDWEILHARRDDILNQLMSLRGRWSSARSNPIVNWEIASSQRALLAMTFQQLPITNYQSPISSSPISNSLISSLAIADLPASLTAAKQLAGLGIGLTPAGDDFILGALYAAWIIHPPKIASALARETAETAASLTTSLSAAWLKSAGAGEAGILWHDLFNALLLTSPNASASLRTSLQSPISNLLAVGHTSGADALAGFICTLISYAESQTKSCPS
ncbi:MAG: DUF2877 domain-containing protein [Chloroflexi bacterium]|nr:DUF2877 domain-containing protein [Chloroflexota bacterium]